MKELNNKNTERINRSKKEASKSSTNIYILVDMYDIKKGIKEIDTITYAWNIKKGGTKVALHVLCRKKSGKNNKY